MSEAAKLEAANDASGLELQNDNAAPSLLSESLQHPWRKNVTRLPHITPSEPTGQSDVEYESKNIYFASVRSPGIAGSEDLIFPESWDTNKAL